MKDLNSHCRLAIVQAAPVMFDKDACLEKAIRLIEEAAQNGAELIVFPELFLPGYPYGMTFGYTVGSRKEPGRADWKIYYDNSILSNGAEMQQLIDCAKRLDVYLSLAIPSAMRRPRHFITPTCSFPRKGRRSTTASSSPPAPSASSGVMRNAISFP